MNPSTSTTIYVLGAGAAVAATALVLAKRWEKEKTVSATDLLIALAPAGAYLAYLWVTSKEKPSVVQTIASGIRGASRGAI